jgi:hypothetical protein
VFENVVGRKKKSWVIWPQEPRKGSWHEFQGYNAIMFQPVAHEVLRTLVHVCLYTFFSFAAQKFSITSDVYDERANKQVTAASIAHLSAPTPAWPLTKTWTTSYFPNFTIWNTIYELKQLHKTYNYIDIYIFSNKFNDCICSKRWSFW